MYPLNEKEKKKRKKKGEGGKKRKKGRERRKNRHRQEGRSGVLFQGLTPPPPFPSLGKNLQWAFDKHLGSCQWLSQNNLCDRIATSHSGEGFLKLFNYQ